MKKYTEKKIKNQVFNKLIQPFVSSQMMERITDCGSFLMFLSDLNLEHTKLHTGDFCKNRFCPMCSWRLARKDSLKITVLMEYIKHEFNKEFIFLTLTTPNVRGDKLAEEIQKYNKDFKKLMKRKEVSKITKGYIRKLEVTYDKDEFITKELYQKKKSYYDRRDLKFGNKNPTFDTYNPHFHVLIAINKSYFTDKNYYITHEQWLELWREATGDYTITQVGIRKATTSDLKGIYEVAKYSAKDSDYLTSETVFKTFYKALKGKQLIVYGGFFKDALTKFKNGELNKYMPKDRTEYIYEIIYKWQISEYEQYEKRELTEDEKKKFNQGFIDGLDSDDD